MFHWDGLEYPKGATQLIKRRVINFEEIFSLFTKSFGNDKTSVYLVAYLMYTLMSLINLRLRLRLIELWRAWLFWCILGCLHCSA